MKSRNNKLQFGKRILIHILLWVIVLIFFSFFIGIEGENILSKFTFSVFFLPVTITTTYVFVYNLIPNYLLPKRYFRFGLYSIYSFIISAVFIIMTAFYGFILSFGLEWNDRFPISKSIFYIMITIYLIVVIASAFSLLKNNYSSVAKNEELKNRILEAQLKLKEQELQYLKMQIHPHFLFNTLNTIYGFSMMKNEKTPEMILQLSELLDYILYQTKKPTVKLQEEINHIKNYIELEKKRFQEALEIDIYIEKINREIQIAPMLLLPFVENSFKHGKDAEGKLRIKISMKFISDFLIFEIENSKDAEASISEEKGIGLQNIKRRLELIYPKNFEMKTENNRHSFKASLKLNVDQIPKNVR